MIFHFISVIVIVNVLKACRKVNNTVLLYAKSIRFLPFKIVREFYCVAFYISINAHAFNNIKIVQIDVKCVYNFKIYTTYIIKSSSKVMYL